MSRTLYFAYPGDLQTRTGGYGYDRRVACAFGALDWDVQLVALGKGFPMEPDFAEAEKALAAIPEGSLVVIDGLAFGVLDEWADRNASRLRLYALVHHPLALETGLTTDLRDALTVSERKALSCTRGVIVTSNVTARELVARYGVVREDIVVALPGTDPVSLATGTCNPPCILSVGSLTRRKGHDVLIAALTVLREIPWTCRIVGNKHFDPIVTGELAEQIRKADLAERIVLVGEVEDPRAEFAHADIFALASRYEGYGMVFAEALAHGLPIVGCAAGAVPEVVPEAAGILVSPDDPKQLAMALRRLLTEAETLSAMADAAAIAGAALPSWRDTAATISTFLERKA